MFAAEDDFAGSRGENHVLEVGVRAR
jgi:hypothetical protein